MTKLKVGDKTIKAPKGMNELEMLKLKQRFGRSIDASSKRKRPRNPNEEKVLKRWEKERGGTKIGEI